MWDSNLELMVGNDETVLWRGKPNKKCFILECIFNPMLPFAIVWALFDSVFIGALMFVDKSEGGIGGGMLLGILAFFTLHLMPVWIYLGGVLLSFRKYKNTTYIITDKGIYVSGGTFTYNYEMKPFAELAHVGIHQGIIDQLLHVGDVVLQCAHTNIVSTNSHSHREHAGLTICDIPDFREVFKLVRDLQTDVYSDTMYPNDLRPAENHGYRTKYVPRDDEYDKYPDFQNDGFN